MAEYKSVRALLRGIDLLRALSEDGPSTVNDLAVKTDIHRTTVYRLLSTLASMDYVAFNDSDGTYRLTAAVRSLSDGYRERDWIREVAYPEIAALTEKVMWPVNIAMPRGDEMVVQESTHHLSPFSIHRSMVGTRWPIMISSHGRAYLSFIEEPKLSETLELLSHSTLERNQAGRDPATVQRLIATTRSTGYASCINEAVAGISSIAIPLVLFGRVVGSLNIVFFSSAMTPAKAAEKYLEPMRETAKRIAELTGRNHRATHLHIA